MIFTSPEINSLVLIYVVFFLQNASPGVNVFAVAGTAMGVGRLSAFALSAGIATGTLTWSSLSVLGLSVVIAKIPTALLIIKVLGAGYLIWLSYKSFKSSLSKVDLNDLTLRGDNKSLVNYFLRGYLINMTNPKAAIGWIAIVALGLDEHSQWWMGPAIIFGTTTISALVHIAYSTLFSTNKMLKIYASARRPIQACLGGFFLFAGFSLAASSASSGLRS